jgi:hypothetical protein
LTDEQTLMTQAKLLSLLDRIGELLSDVRELVINGDPEMNEALRKAEHGEL